MNPQECGFTAVLTHLSNAWRIEHARPKCLRCGHDYNDHRDDSAARTAGPCKTQTIYSHGLVNCACTKFASSWVDDTPSEHWRQA